MNLILPVVTHHSATNPSSVAPATTKPSMFGVKQLYLDWTIFDWCSEDSRVTKVGRVQCIYTRSTSFLPIAMGLVLRSINKEISKTSRPVGVRNPPVLRQFWYIYLGLANIRFQCLVLIKTLQKPITYSNSKKKTTKSRFFFKKNH